MFQVYCVYQGFQASAVRKGPAHANHPAVPGALARARAWLRREWQAFREENARALSEQPCWWPDL